MPQLQAHMCLATFFVKLLIKLRSEILKMQVQMRLQNESRVKPLSGFGAESPKTFHSLTLKIKKENFNYEIK